jgi:uncharacterized protein with PIN domain
LILDSSAIIAILCREPGYEILLKKIAEARLIVIGAPTLAETQLALTVKLKRDASGEFYLRDRKSRRAARSVCGNGLHADRHRLLISREYELPRER